MPVTTGTHKDLRILFFFPFVDSPTPSIGESGSRRLSVSVTYRGVGESLSDLQ